MNGLAQRGMSSRYTCVVHAGGWCTDLHACTRVALFILLPISAHVVVHHASVSFACLSKWWIRRATERLKHEHRRNLEKNAGKYVHLLLNKKFNVALVPEKLNKIYVKIDFLHKSSSITFPLIRPTNVQLCSLKIDPSIKDYCLSHR